MISSSFYPSYSSFGSMFHILTKKDKTTFFSFQIQITYIIHFYPFLFLFCSLYNSSGSPSTLYISICLFYFFYFISSYRFLLFLSFFFFILYQFSGPSSLFSFACSGATLCLFYTPIYLFISFLLILMILLTIIFFFFFFIQKNII